jgi:hypothetical protein
MHRSAWKVFCEVRPRCLACTQSGRDELSRPAARISPLLGRRPFRAPFGPTRVAMARKLHGRSPETLRQCATEAGWRD